MSLPRLKERKCDRWRTRRFRHIPRGMTGSPGLKVLYIEREYSLASIVHMLRGPDTKVKYIGKGVMSLNRAIP